MADQPLWHGRFEVSPAETLMKFTESLSFDQKLWRDDIAGSKAHVKGLVHAQIISKSEGETILSALETVYQEFARNKFEFVQSDEDIHTPALPAFLLTYSINFIGSIVLPSTAIGIPLLN